MAWVFAIGTASAKYELQVILRDAAGQPLRLQPVLVWRYDYPTQELRTDSAGRLMLTGYEQFATNVLTGPHRPAFFPIRLAFPGLSPLFYRFELRRDGPAPYQVFNTQYDYPWGTWVGDFDHTGRVRSQTKPDNKGKLYTAVPPTGGQTLLWQARATLHRIAKEGAGSRYSIGLDLQQNGIEEGLTR
jgi:hypothetical protein